MFMRVASGNSSLAASVILVPSPEPVPPPTEWTVSRVAGLSQCSISLLLLLRGVCEN